ncbi:TspO/MBR family protein [Dyadobacter diqingensis]|uniref:TspO/MBR family protein n=1 Tax=Dyadobacter diqingensis TaxID=2938121 RepID=UPI0020C2F4EA|nr:TspO/MBR family protein [Dyadobacter diqingensis]
MNSNSVLKFTICIVPPLAVGAIAGFFTSKAIPGWYATLNQPSFNPPNWVFGPVWTTLYILMGLSIFLIWRLPASSTRTKAMVIYYIQLLLNFCWSFLFFYYKNMGFALIEIFLLWLNIVLMLLYFYKLKPAASYMNIPYLLWVSFATVLNGAYYLLNQNNL